VSGPWAAVAALPWRGGWRPGEVWRRLPGLLLVLLLPAAAALRWSLSPATVAAAVALTLLAWAWWLQAGGLLRQNRPALARLLPRQAQVLQASLLVQAALVALAGTALARWGLDAGPEAAAWTVAAVLAAVWLQREPWLWLPLWLAPALPLPWRALVQAIATAPPVLQAALLAAAALLLLAALGRGGAWHRRDDARRQRWAQDERAQSEGRARPLALRPPWMRALAWPFAWPLGWWRRRLLDPARPGPVLARLELGLHTGGTGPMLAWILALVAVGVALGLTAAVQLAGVRVLHVVDGAHVGMCMGLFAALQSPAMDRAGALWGRRPEQALLVLLPGPPAGAALADALLARWRRGQLVAWALATATLLILTSFGSPGSQHFAGGFAAACLPLIVWSQWRVGRLRAAPGLLEPWIAGPVLAALPGWAAEVLAVPVPVSLALGLGLAATGAVALRRPAGALLPVGRGGG
jgi:hypothetical protein